MSIPAEMEWQFGIWYFLGTWGLLWCKRRKPLRCHWLTAIATSVIAVAFAYSFMGLLYAHPDFFTRPGITFFLEIYLWFGYIPSTVAIALLAGKLLPGFNFAWEDFWDIFRWLVTFVVVVFVIIKFPPLILAAGGYWFFIKPRVSQSNDQSPTHSERVMRPSDEDDSEHEY